MGIQVLIWATAEWTSQAHKHGSKQTGFISERKEVQALSIDREKGWSTLKERTYSSLFSY